MRTIQTLLLALTLLGCDSIVYEPCVDGGAPIPADDGGAGDPLDGTITSASACRLIENTQQAHDALRACGLLDCPWRGFSGPGTPPLACDPVAVIDCAEALDRTNTCEDARTALEACDETACTSSGADPTLPPQYITSQLACSLITAARTARGLTCDVACPFPTPGYSDPGCAHQTPGGGCITPCDPNAFERCMQELESRANSCAEYRDAIAFCARLEACEVAP